MPDSKPPKNLASNFVWAGVLAFLGFLHPLFFLFAAFVAWLAWYELKNSDNGGLLVGSGRRPHVDQANRDWAAGFLAACDSPAEEAFLSEAIRHFQLGPVLGLLRGERLTLQLQVEIDRYRVDFLANDWLVIEVDGAAWHSSEEAVSRDAERDACLTENGFAVLRLPAKLVFDQPGKSMQRVELALLAGKPQMPERPRPGVSFGKALADVGTFIDDVDNFVQRQREVEQALCDARDVIATERTLLDEALRSAQTELKTQQYRSRGPEHAAAFDKAYEEMEEVLGRFDGPADYRSEVVKLLPLLRPEPHPIAETHEAIQHGFDRLVEDREEYFRSVRKRSRQEPLLEPHARTYLKALQCERLWDDAIGLLVLCHTASPLPVLDLVDEVSSVSTRAMIATTPPQPRFGKDRSSATPRPRLYRP